MRKKKIFLIPIVLGIVLYLSVGLLGVSDRSQSKKILTLYQSGPSLVVERTELGLNEGINHLTMYLPGSVVSRTIFVTSPDATLESLRVAPAVDSESGILKSLVGEEISVTKTGDAGTTVKGTLIGVVGGQPLLKTADGETRLIKNPGEYRFDGFYPEKMDTSVKLELSSDVKSDTNLTVGYQLSGLNWSPQYVGFLNEKEGLLDLNGLAHIENETGWNFQKVHLRLLAGEPKREEAGTRYFALARASNKQMESAAPEQVFDYYRYKIEKPLDLPGDVATQVKFFHRDSVSYEKYYLFEPYSSSAVRTMIHLENTEEKGLGVPISSGTVRLYEDTEEKTFIGADAFPNLPVGEDVKLELGDAFDLKGDRARTDHERIGEDIWKDRIELTVNNRKEEPADLLIRERLPGDWEILKSSHEYKKVNSSVIEYEKTIPAEGSVEISYVVQYEL